MAQNRFEEKFTKHESGCWLWNAACRTTGYGVFSYNGKPVTASRVSYILYKGTDPGDLFVCHTCDNPKCVNPDHLFLGTNQDNVEDRKRKGRPVGRLSSITQEQYDSVLKMISSGDYKSLREIATISQIPRSTIQRIAKDKFTIRYKEK